MRLPLSRPLRVLVVCTGNICRSPMGQMMLAAELEAAGVEAEVVSGGTSSYEAGNPVDPRAAETLRRHGVAVVEHTAREVTGEELAAADLVLAMTEEHAQWLRSLARRTGTDPARIAMWREADAPQEDAGGSGRRGGSSLDVPDPWWGDEADFEQTWSLLDPGARALATALAAGATELRP